MDLSPVMWGGRDESSVWGPGTHESFLCLPDSRPGFWNIFAITVNFTQSHLPLYFSSIVFARTSCLTVPLLRPLQMLLHVREGEDSSHWVSILIKLSLLQFV